MNNYKNNNNNNINSSSKQQMIIIKEGLLKKRSGRMVQWTTRYFTLYTTSLSYRTNQDQHESSRSTTTSYELVPGCLVTDITEEMRVNIKGKKLYSFWVVWPHDKSSGCDYDNNNSNNNNNNNIDDGNKEVHNGEIDSDGEQHHFTGTTISSADTNMSVDDNDGDSGHSTLNTINQAIASSSLTKLSSDQSSSSSSSAHGLSLKGTTIGRKDVQSIVASEMMIQKRQRQLVEEQVEKHQAHDINVATGAKIAAVALGGVAIGVMTMVG
jgi:hypothetical protein